MTITRHQAVGAYQRWTPPSFDEEPAADGTAEPEGGAPALDQPQPPRVDRDAEPASPESDARPPEPDPEPEPAGVSDPPIKWPTADEIETMFEQARAEGMTAGLEEGAAQARAQAESLAKIVASMDAALEKLDGEVADELVELALAVARRIVGQSLVEHPESIADTVKEALAQLPQSKTKIHLHPEDARLVRDYLQDHFDHGHHHIVEDETITRGGCTLEAAGCEIDATMETRWQRVLEGFGRDEPER